MTKIISKRSIPDLAILTLMYFQLIIFEFLGFGTILNKLVLLLILLRVCFAKGKIPFKLIVAAASVFVFYGVNCLGSELFFKGTAKSNFIMQLYPMAYTFYLAYLCSNRREWTDRLFAGNAVLFNLTMAVNFIVLLIQIKIPYSINAVNRSGNVISFYPDLISGLFAYASTHVLSLFVIFVVLFDICLIRSTRHVIKKKLLFLFLLLSLATFIYVSFNNDNKAFFLLFPIALVMLWFIEGAVSKRRLLIIIVCLLAVMAVSVVLYFCISQLREYIDRSALKFLIYMKEAIYIGTDAKGSNERIAMLAFAFAMPSTWLLGTGFAENLLYNDGYLGFAHFGQGALGSFMIIGSIWYTIIMLHYYQTVFKIMIFGEKKKRGQGLVLSFVAVFLICVTIYTQAFTRPNVMICMSLIMLSLRQRYLNISAKE